MKTISSNISNKKQNNLLLIKYFFVIVTILEYNSVYCRLLNGGSIIDDLVNLLWQFLLVILFISSFHNNDIHVNLLVFDITFFLFVFLVLIFNYIKFPFSKILFVKFIIDPLILINYFYNENLNNNVFRIFVKIMTILAGFSILCWLLINFHLYPNINISVNFAGETHLYPSLLGLQVIDPYKYNFLGLHVIRNVGIFSEAPMYSYMLTMAIFIKLFLLNNNKLFTRGFYLLILANIITFSTTGIIFSLLSVIYIFILKNNHKNIINWILLFISFIISFFIVKVLFVGKVHQGMTNTQSSYNIRSDDIRSSISAWKSHVIFGNGLNNKDSIISHMSPSRLIPGITPSVTTGLFSILAFGGIILFLYYLIPIILLFMFRYFKIFGFSLFILLILISVYAQYSYIYILSYAFCWSVILKYYKIYNKKHNNKII